MVLFYHVLKIMRSNEINLEKLKLLISGLADGDSFNKRIKLLRKELKIPARGLKTAEDSQNWHKAAMTKQDEIFYDPKWVERVYALDRNDPDYQKKYRDLHKEGPINLLTYSIQEIMKDYADLAKNLEDSVRGYILFNSLSPSNNWTVFSTYEGDRHVTGVKFFGYVTKEEMESAFDLAKMITRESFSQIKPHENIDQDIKILKLSKKKGSMFKSALPELDPPSKYTDATIVSKITPEHLDTRSNAKKHQTLVRVRRLRTEERIRKHFPKLQKQRYSKP